MLKVAQKLSDGYPCRLSEGSQAVQMAQDVIPGNAMSARVVRRQAQRAVLRAGSRAYSALMRPRRLSNAGDLARGWQ